MNLTSGSSNQLSNFSLSNSSKSTSRKSDISENLAENNGGAITPIDMEALIQTDRITKILTKAIYKTKLALCLPKLIKQEYRVLKSIIKKSHFDELVYLFEHYDSPLVSASLRNIAALENIKDGDFSLRNRLNLEITQVTSILTQYPTLCPVVENMFNYMKLRRLDQKDRSSLEYLLKLEHFLELLQRQMNTTAAEELAAKLQMNKLNEFYKRIIPQIKELQTTLKQEHTEFEEIVNIKTRLINKLKQELAFHDHDANMKIKKNVLDSDRQMVLVTRAYEKKAVILKEEEAESRERYDNFLTKHLVDEKGLRARRFKVETQLLFWIQKYDIDMTDKRAELDELTENYDDEAKKCEELKEKLMEQDKEYISLMKERDDEYHAEMTAKADEFTLDHAARVLQRAYQQVLENRKEKEKLKKELKLLKKQQELEEKRAEKEAAGRSKKKLKSGGN